MSTIKLNVLTMQLQHVFYFIQLAHELNGNGQVHRHGLGSTSGSGLGQGFGSTTGTGNGLGQGLTTGSGIGQGLGSTSGSGIGKGLGSTSGSGIEIKRRKHRKRVKINWMY